MIPTYDSNHCATLTVENTVSLEYTSAQTYNTKEYTEFSKQQLKNRRKNGCAHVMRKFKQSLKIYDLILIKDG